MKKSVSLLCVIVIIVSCILQDLDFVRADSNTVTYSLGSNADISLKKDENKIIYSRMHYSSGSGIRYYTQYFVISLQKAALTDDLSSLDSANNDCSIILQVSSGGESVKENEAEKSGDFYWYDSEPNDDGYIRTTYVIDGNIFLQLLDMAEMTGKKGELYIHHVFAIAGGKEDDSWHKEYKVKNDVPYFKYSDLMKLHWNNTTATQDSQKSCLNIPVPYRRPNNTGAANNEQRDKIALTQVPTPPPGLTQGPDVKPAVVSEATPTPTRKPKATSTPTPTPTRKPKATSTPAPTPTRKPKATSTPTPTRKPKATSTPAPTPTRKPKATMTPTPTRKPKATSTPTPTRKPKATTTPTPTRKPKATSTPTPTPTPTPRPDIKLSSESGVLNYVQKINADTDNVQLVLDGEQDSELILDVLNYDTDVRISFPFEVRSSDGYVLAAHTWNPLHSSYIIPSDTDEGIYTIKAAAVSQSTGLFLSTDELKVEISGKLYGLKLIDNNSSAAEWKDVFRSDGVSKNLFAFLYEDGTGKISFDRLYRYYYSSGLNDRFGNRTQSSEKYTLPVVDGDSPIPVAAGMLKSGYTWKFELKTYGNLMAETGSHIVIKPSFYYLGTPEKSSVNGTNYRKLLGSTVREEVDLFGYDIGNSLKKEGQLIEARKVSRNDGEVTWEFEYQLPDSWYCIPKSVDLDSYIGKKGGLTFKEEFWKEKGFVTVSFEIGAYSASGNLVMTYSNTEENVRKGMCDMWSMEGYRTSKTDCFLDTFLLKEGDVILVRIPGSTKDSTGVPSIPTNSSEDKIVTSN